MRMTRKEAIEELKKVDTLDMQPRLCKAHYMAIKALEQEPCEVEEDKLQQAYNKGFEDCRKAVLEPYRILDDRDTICVRWIRKDVEQIQPVNPQEAKTGHWIKNLCDSCTNKACEFQSEIQRSKCDFYIAPMPHLEPDNCGNYVIQQEPMVEIDLYSVIKQKYIERDVLDKIRAEIKQKYCDRNICISNEYGGISCDECEVTKSQKPQKSEEF